MKAKLIKQGYGLLMALAVTMQLVAAPLVLGAELNWQPDIGVIVPNNECQGSPCE